jgi:hypothetical protein
MVYMNSGRLLPLTADGAGINFIHTFRTVSRAAYWSRRPLSLLRATSQPHARQLIPSDPADFVRWLNALYHVGRDWGFITLESIFVHEARGKKINRIVNDYLRPVRVRIAHAVLDSGELTLSAERGHGYCSGLQVALAHQCIARFLMKTKFPISF